MGRLIVGLIGAVVFWVLVVPGGVVMLLPDMNRQDAEPSPQLPLENIAINVYLHEQGRVETMNLEEYVKGVLGAEMPAEFAGEALKAQAVAARTYAVKHMRSFGGSGLAGVDDADISTDYTVDQAWASPELLQTRWGVKYAGYWRKISQAVEFTRGEVLVYDNALIDALFHSTSGERTASAKEVWGYEVPYLQSVECIWDKASPRYQDSKTVALAEIGVALGIDAAALPASGTAVDAAQVLSRTESGRVKEARIGGKTFTGQEIRRLLGLRSSNFTVGAEDNKLVFNSVGYGHGVGLCQYGANGMAKEGRNYRDILRHYYSDVELKNIYGS